LTFTNAVLAQELSIPGFHAPVEKKGDAEQEIPVQIRAVFGQAPLSRLYDHLRVEQLKIRRLPALARSEMRQASTDKKLQIGTTRAIGLPLDMVTESALYRVAEGDVRVMGVISPGALFTRAHFTGMNLPAGARVFVYSLNDPEEFYGPYEGRGPAGDGAFWTPPMKGEGVVIEYLSPNPKSEAEPSPFQVSEISHIYRDPLTETPSEASAGSCNLEVSNDWSEVAKSVGQLQFTSNGAEFTCTGTLLNNPSNDRTPYMLTANHCFDTQAEAQTLRVYWFYNSGDTPPSGTPRTDGANLLATGRGSDFTLVLLTGSLPGGLFFSGWDANPISAGTPVTGIHHPQGSHKRISFGTTNSNCASGLPGPCSNFTGLTWNSGMVESGSSGSGLWTGSAANPQLVGTLTGGSASCTNPTLSDYYARFSVIYPNIAPFLTVGRGVSCVSALSATSQNFSKNGGNGSISVTAPGECQWSPTVSHSFVTITSGWNGSGSGPITFSVAPNNGVFRTALIVIGTQVFTVTQAGFGNSCGKHTITLGQTTNGLLAKTDCQNADGTFYEPYQFQATAGQQISLSMSASFNTYLTIIGPNGAVFATDDDGGGGTNSRIPAGSGLITLPTTGPYTILVSAVLPYVNGNYTLTLDGPALPKVTPSASISDVGVAEGNGGDITFARFNITFSEPTTKSVCLMVSTGEGTATRDNDYRGVGGSIGSPPDFVFFDPGVTQGTYTVTVIGDTRFEPDETFLVNIDACNPDVTIGRGQGVGRIINDDPSPDNVQLSTASYSVSESDGSISVEVQRFGDSSGAATVQYSTSDTAGLTPCATPNGIASSRCDYATSIGTLQFSAGETSKTVLIPVVNDAWAEGAESLTISLSNPAGVPIGARSSATITITDNDASSTAANPIDQSSFFIRQQYVDFLGREPDTGGLQGWQDVLNNCGTTVAQPCDKIEVSAGFFRSREFQERGYFVYKFYSAIGRIPLYPEFMPDLAKVSGFLSDQQLEANRVAFVTEFMARSDYQNKYGSLADPTAYVDALLTTVGLQNHPSRGGWIAGLQNNTLTKAKVFRELTESSEMQAKYNTEAFVIMQYFGYLRRSADGSYLAWIDIMNQNPNNYRGMIDGFLNSDEYRKRFGQ
jgi:hypothetical protein